MTQRKSKLFPRQVSDVGAFIFVWVMIPATYMYETQLVVPSLYKDDYTSLILHNIFGLFLLFNLLGNFIGKYTEKSLLKKKIVKFCSCKSCSYQKSLSFWRIFFTFKNLFVGLWLTDTSTRFVVLPSVIKNSRWKFCASCESVTPPRAWHCNICNICILKREHHCMFVGYCVGHRNHRYFCLFLFYMWISVIYCTYFNLCFLWPQLSEASWGQIMKFIFPMVMLITGLDASWLQVYIFFTSVHFAAFLLTAVLLGYHANLVFRGRTTYENNNNIGLYNLGWKQNLVEVLGKNWKKAIFWPRAPSAMPHNGVDWDTTETWSIEGPKNR